MKQGSIHVVREGEKWAWSSFRNCVFLQSAIQDVDYENEVELLYAVVTLPDGDEGTLALLCFVDDKTGMVTKKVPLPTWKPVRRNYRYLLECSM